MNTMFPCGNLIIPGSTTNALAHLWRLLCTAGSLGLVTPDNHSDILDAVNVIPQLQMQIKAEFLSSKTAKRQQGNLSGVIQ
jgi:hypothetical protein